MSTIETKFGALIQVLRDRDALPKNQNPKDLAALWRWTLSLWGDEADTAFEDVTDAMVEVEMDQREVVEYLLAAGFMNQELPF